ncbi:hypothetical protein AK812_SmicGene1348 [Symbiodinium microadriaticum]|uniref:Uncharacterized protein n=1 Tax=Symbiodinium microadriaticum TaxID=2951 RepID=A0A1Q9F4E6_SYMMI|nr:hypothetical protein AK812_SmicGene1348 [Symbiodinium microadriaticum]
MGAVAREAISEALGAEASKVQAAAVEGHGENPVKVLLPQYPIHPNLLSIDHTQPAKLQDPEAPDEVELELAKPPSPYGYMPNYPGPGMAPPPRPLLSPGDTLFLHTAQMLFPPQAWPLACQRTPWRIRCPSSRARLLQPHREQVADG